MLFIIQRQLIGICSQKTKKHTCKDNNTTLLEWTRVRKCKSEIDQLIVTSQPQNVYNWVQNWKPTNVFVQIATARFFLIKRYQCTRAVTVTAMKESVKSIVNGEEETSCPKGEVQPQQPSCWSLLFVVCYKWRTIWLRNSCWWNQNGLLLINLAIAGLYSFIGLYITIKCHFRGSDFVVKRLWWP